MSRSLSCQNVPDAQAVPLSCPTFCRRGARREHLRPDQDVAFLYPCSAIVVVRDFYDNYLCQVVSLAFIFI